MRPIQWCIKVFEHADIGSISTFFYIIYNNHAQGINAPQHSVGKNGSSSCFVFYALGGSEDEQSAEVIGCYKHNPLSLTCPGITKKALENRSTSTAQGCWFPIIHNVEPNFYTKWNGVADKRVLDLSIISLLQLLV